MKTGVVGGRNYKDKAEVYRILDQEDISEIISGDCPTGVDKFAKDYATDRGIKYTGHPADWEKSGKSAGPIRNKLIIDDSERLIALWDGKSPGTRSSIEFAKKKGIPIKIFTI